MAWLFYSHSLYSITVFIRCYCRHTDFRELVRDLFATFKTRIWMQKIKSHDSSVLRPFQLPEQSAAALSLQSSAGYLSASRFVGRGPGTGSSSLYESEASGGYANYRQSDTDNRERGHYQFGGAPSHSVSPSYGRAAGAPPPFHGTLTSSGGSYGQQRRSLPMTRGPGMLLDSAQRSAASMIYFDDAGPHSLVGDSAPYSSRGRTYDAVEAPRSSSDSHLVTWAQQQRYSGMGDEQLVGDSPENERATDMDSLSSDLSTLSVTAKPYVFQGGGGAHYAR